MRTANTKPRTPAKQSLEEKFVSSPLATEYTLSSPEPIFEMRFSAITDRRRLLLKSFDHVQQRLSERYGISIDREEYGKLVHKVQAMKGVVKLRTKRSGCVLYAVLMSNVWIPVLYDPDVSLVTTVYPRNLVEFYRKRISDIDGHLKRLQQQSCPNPSSRAELVETIAAIRAKEKELDRIRKANTSP